MLVLFVTIIGGVITGILMHYIDKWLDRRD